jgi:hypothetical protein
MPHVVIIMGDDTGRFNAGTYFQGMMAAGARRLAGWLW